MWGVGKSHHLERVNPLICVAFIESGLYIPTSLFPRSPHPSPDPVGPTCPHEGEISAVEASDG